MKIRSGFVSNSSSSSYIIAFDKKDQEKLEDLYNGGSKYETKIWKVGAKEIVEDLKESHCIGIRLGKNDLWPGGELSEEYYYEEFVRFSVKVSKISRELAKGKEIAIVRISDSDRDDKFLPSWVINLGYNG